jgi:DDE superfamily endonuclease
MRLVNDVMTTEPYASARRVFWIVDNGSSHRGAASVNRLHDAHDNAHVIHLPVHASWLNQVEIYFSVIQRKVLTPNDFADLARSRHNCSRSRITTLRSPPRSSGSSPPPTCTTCSTAAPTMTTSHSRRPPNRYVTAIACQST